MPAVVNFAILGYKPVAVTVKKNNGLSDTCRVTDGSRQFTYHGDLWRHCNRPDISSASQL